MNKCWSDRQFRPQPAERWAMYRLITPIVDEACIINGLEPYFEYFRPNGPNRRLSVDIALIDGSRPVWMVEAKKFSRPLNPGFIAPYLTHGEMGVVSNGNTWIFCIGNETAVVGPILDSQNYIIRSEVDRIVGALSKTEPSAAKAALCGWKAEWTGYKAPAFQKIWHLEKGSGERIYAEKSETASLREAVDTILSTYESVRHNSAIGRFLAILQEGEVEISVGCIELSVNRLVWKLPDGRRGARITLSGRQLEILVHNDIVRAVKQETILAHGKMHDKNPNMTTYKANTDAELASLAPVFNVIPPAA